MINIPRKSCISIILLIIFCNIVAVLGKSIVKTTINKNLRQKQLCMFSSDDSNGNSNNRNKRIISPNDISSLFTKKTITPNNNKLVSNNFDDDVDEDEDGGNDTDENYEDEFNISKAVEDSNKNIDVKEIIERPQQMQINSFDDPIINESTEENGLDYADLSKSIDKTRRKSVVEALGMIQQSDKTIASIARNVKYDPAVDRRDPMQYGAYRRWKLAETDVKSKVGSKKKKKTANGKNAAEKFYDAIKNLGSAPTTGGVTGTGVADPPPNKGSVTPKKAPIKKNRKRVVTPDDIDSLFSKNENKSKQSNVIDLNDNDDDNDIIDDDEDDDDKNTNNLSMRSLLKEEIPKWLEDADNAEKKRRAMLKKGKKKNKSLVDDWRFWAGIIATAAFASAFYSVYSQSGGNFNDIFGNGSSNNELVI